MQNTLVKKYILDIIFIIVFVTLLTFFWFGPYKDKVRIKESLMASNIEFNKDIEYTGFDYISFDNNKITKNLEVTNNSNKEISYIISFNSLNTTNNYVNYTITDSNGDISPIRTLSLDGYILVNNINSNQTKKYTITIWSNDKKIDGNLNLLLNPIIA